MFSRIQKWFAGWSWTATGTMLMSLAISVVVILIADTNSPLEFWRNLVVGALLLLMGCVLAVKLSDEQKRRDSEQREMITGGDNFCYLTIERKDLHNSIYQLRLWIKSTGPLLNVTYHISPADSVSGHGDPRYFYLDDLAVRQAGGGPSGGGPLGILQKGSRAIVNTLWTVEVLKWRVQFTARNGGWTQWIDLTRLDKGFRDTTKVVHDDGRVLWPPEAPKQG